MSTRMTAVLLMLTMCLVTVCAQPVHAGNDAIPRIIFDSDMSSDWDDVGDAAILHGLASLGECEIIGMMVSSTNGGTALCMDAINTYYGKPDIPIGVRPDTGGLGMYAARIATEFSHDLASPKDCPLAVDLYRKLLAESPDKSVVIVTVGYLNNLEALLKSESDKHSPLNGKELIRKKVKVWACAGGAYPKGSEFNFAVEPSAAHYVINHWPTAATFTTFRLGHTYFTCGRLPQLPRKHPIRRVYVDIKNKYPYPSWGQVAILQAIRGDEQWGKVDVGRNNANPNGSNYWTKTPDPTGPDDQAYLLAKARTPVRDTMDALIMLPPNDGKASIPGEPTDLRATVIDSSRINLQWTDNAFNEERFIIERRGDDGYQQIGMVAANVTSYSLEGLTSTANRSFRVKASNATGDSCYAYVWVYTGWTEYNFQSPDALPLYHYYQHSHLRNAKAGGDDHITINNDSAHGRELTIDVDTVTQARRGNLYVYFFYQNKDNWYRLNYGVKTCTFEKRVNGNTKRIAQASVEFDPTVRVLRPWRIEVTPAGQLKFIDKGVLVLNVMDAFSFHSGKIGLGGVGRTPVWESFRFSTSPHRQLVETPPLPPHGIIAISGDGQVELSWKAVHGAERYTVKVSPSRLEPFVNVTTVTEPSFTHTNLTNDRQYHYVVSATNTAGEGQISKAIHGRPIARGSGPGGSTIIGTPGSFGRHDNTIQKVFDGNFMTIFDAPKPSGAWVGLDYGTPRIVTAVKYAPSPYHSKRMVAGKFQGANQPDFSDAVTLFTVTDVPPIKKITSQPIKNRTPFRYLRYIGPDHCYCNVAEMTFEVSNAD